MGPRRPSTPPTQPSELADGVGETLRTPRTGLPEIGDVVERRWRIDAVIGSGGMAQVFAAFDPQAGEDVALKVLAPVLGADAESLERFTREQRALASLTTPHCVRIRDVGTLPNGLPFLTMELLRGKDLGHMLADSGPLPIADACAYVAQACGALAEAHRAGLVHRDLKPGNLFVEVASGNTSIVRVLDFGVARMLGRRDAPVDTITKAGSVVGTLAYMAPEQIRSSHHVDARADIWALGACLYKLLANRAPFLPSPEVSLVEAIHAHAPTPLVALRPDVPDALEAIVLRCLQKDPAARYASAEALARALDDVRSQLQSGATELCSPIRPADSVATEPGPPAAFFATTLPMVERTVTAPLHVPPLHVLAPPRVPVEQARVPSAAPRGLPAAVVLLLCIAAFVALFALGAGIVLYRAG